MTASTSRQVRSIALPEDASPVPKTEKHSRKGKEPAPALAQDGQGLAARDLPGDNEDLAWNWVSLTDSSASKVPPIFTKDKSYFFSIVGSSVKVHSAATGRIVSTLLTPLPEEGSSDPGVLTAAVLNPTNEFQLITASSTGRIAVWDVLDASLIKIIDIEQPIMHMCAHPNFKDAIFVTTLKRKHRKGRIDESGAVLRVSLIPSDTTAQLRVQRSSDIQPVGKTHAPAGLAFSSSGSWLVAISGHTAYVASATSFSAGFTKYVSSERLTCLAFHPSEDYFATGDDKGFIRLWYCLNENQPVDAKDVEKKAQTTLLHWHAHAVTSIAFTLNGAYLLSGGEEAVLVIWQLHTTRKEFVPRIGSPINTIAVTTSSSGTEEFLVGLADATYVFVSSATLKISRLFSRIKLDFTASSASSSSTPLAIHDITATLILPSSHPSSLQVYSPSSSSFVSELEVSPSNRVSRREDKPIEPARVERAVISPNGQWMATIDSREGDLSFHGERYLKIWRWDSGQACWILNTKIDRPHGLQAVNSISFNPAATDSPSSLLVTTGEDGNVKIWRLRLVKFGEGIREDSWVARSSQRIRRELPTHASWSKDGSILAVTSGPFVSLLDPITNQLYRCVASPGYQTACSAHFVGRGSRHLVVVGSKEIVLWDLVNQRPRWQYHCSMQIDSVVPHPRLNSFAILSKFGTSPNEVKTKVSIFSVSSPEPQRVHLLPFTLRNVAWCSLSSCGSPSPSAFSLVGITHTHNVVLVGNAVRLPEQEETTGKGILGESPLQRRTLFQDIFGKSAFEELVVRQLPPERSHPGSGPPFSRILSDEPPHLMPPLESSFDDFIGSLLKTREDFPVELDVVFDEDSHGASEVDPSSEGIPLRSQLVRTVLQGEINSFVELFQRVALDPSSAVSKRPVPKPNGAPKGKINGASHPLHTRSSVKPSSAAPRSETSGLSVSTASPGLRYPSVPVNGRKRKTDVV